MLLRVSLKMKKANIPFENIIFIILNLVFFIFLLIFINNSVNGDAILENKYAKEIALMIDEAKPRTTIYFDIEKGINIAEKNKVDKKDIVKIDEENKKVTVKLRIKGAYSYRYFTDAKISSEIQGSNLVIKIEEKT